MGVGGGIAAGSYGQLGGRVIDLVQLQLAALSAGARDAAVGVDRGGIIADISGGGDRVHGDAATDAV